MEICRINMPPALKRLAEIFLTRAPLYAVGGVVRDSLMGLECHDIDVCSPLRAEEVRELLSDSEFEASDKSMRLGTLRIFGNGIGVEYTAFRTDSYPQGSGAHNPSEVLFTSDIRLDALRRDLKCNAVYYDILADKIVDPLGGVEDIKNGVLNMTAPDVFEADGLRILRLARFKAELGFDIAPATFESALENAWRVKDMAAERIQSEFEGVFRADKKHPELGLKTAHVDGFETLDRLGVIDMVLPEVAALKGLPQPKQYHLYDAYRHSLKAFEIAPLKLRWAALLHDVGKAPAVAAQGNMHGHEILSEQLADKILNRLRFRKSEIKRIKELVRWHMVDINGNMSEGKLRKFILAHTAVIDDLCDLMDVDAIASIGAITRPNRVRETLKRMREEGVPMSVKELCVSGEDLIALGIEERARADVMTALLEDSALNPILMDRDKALAYLKKAAERLEKDKR